MARSNLNLDVEDKWFSKIKKKDKLEKSINWQLAIIKNVNQFNADIETEKKIEGTIRYKDISWTKKEFKDLFKIGDIVYVKKIEDNFYSLQQLPKINGG